MRNSAVIMDDGITCLLKVLGAVETDVFISNLLREPFDYTKWQKEHYSKYSAHEINQMAVQHAKEHPFKLTKTRGENADNKPAY